MSRLLQSGEHPDADQLSAFVDHALPPHEREEMLAHLAECADCRETVALSLPPIESTPGATAAEKGKSWFWGMRLVWPAAVVAGLTVALLYIHHAASSHKGPGATGPMVASESSPPSAKAANVPSPGTANSKAQEKQSQRKKQPRLAVSPPRPAEQPPKALRAGGGGGGAFSFAGPERETSANALQAQAATPPEEKPRIWVRSGASLGRLADEKTTQRDAELHLPGGAAAISAVTRGQQVLAIDARNGVFLSHDYGETWTAIRVPWNGRAVKAELISGSTNSVSLAKSSAGDIGRGSGSGGGTGATAAINSPDAARFKAQGSLNQELKRKYPAALDAPAPASPIAAPRSAVAQGSLTGVVTDRAGAVVARARVVVTDPANHTTKRVETDDKGQYRVDGLAPGAYTLAAEAPGFKTATVSPLQVAASTPNVTNLTLDVGSAAQTVTVQAAPTAPTALQTSSPAVGGTITPQTEKSASPTITGQSITPVFEITTDTGDHWTSADGVNWLRQ